MAVRKTTKRSTDWTTPIKRPEEARFVGTRPGKYNLWDNSPETNKALAAKRKKEEAPRSKKDAKSQKRGLKAANKPLRKTPARTEATRLAAQRAEKTREAYRQGKGPAMTTAERIARNRGTVSDLPKPPGRIKRASNALDTLGRNLTDASSRNMDAKKIRKEQKATAKSMRKPRGGRMGGMLGGGSLTSRTK
jgi:hypothetical protein